jgi:hypothetical protein
MGYVGVHVDQARCYVEPFEVNRTVAGLSRQVGGHDSNQAIRDPDIRTIVQAAGRIDHRGIPEHQVAALCHLASFAIV